MVSFVHYGSLRVATSARRDFDRAVAYLSRDPVEHQPAASIEEIELADRNGRREFVGVQLLLIGIAQGNANHAEHGANRHEQAEEAHRKGKTGADRDVREHRCLKAQQVERENCRAGKARGVTVLYGN